MKIKLNYFIIPFITIVVAFAGTIFTGSGMNWYDTSIIQPDLTPPKWAFPIAWNTIFILTTISAIIAWNKLNSEKNKFLLVFGLFILNAILNIFWSFLFFGNQLILAALIEMLFLNATIIALIILIWKESKVASLLLLPYTLWVTFATYLTYQIFILN